MRGRFTQYGSVALLILLATGVRWLLQPALHLRLVFATYLVAIMFVAWYAGLRPALLATGLAALLSAYFVVPPYGSLDLTQTADLATLIISVLTALTSVFLITALRQARDRAERAAREIQASADRTRTILESISDAFYALDLQGRCVYANDRGAKLVGSTREELFGQDVLQVFPNARGAKASAELRRALAERVPVHFEEYYPALDRWLAVDADPSSEGLSIFARDTSAQKRAEQARLQLAAIVESSDDAIIGKTLEGTIVSWNRGAEKIYGYPAHEVIGRPISILLPPGQEDDLPATMERIRRDESIDPSETKRRRKDGDIIDVSLTISPIKSGSDGIVGASVMARDITERKRAEAERARLLAREQAARAEAERLNRIKDEFLATVSHELRTPLTAVLGWARMLAAGQLSEPERQEAVTVIARNAKAEAQVIDDLLDVSRMVMGKMRLDLQPVEVTHVVEQAIETLRPAAEAKGVRIQEALNPNGIVLADENRLQQVIWNLLSNAIKFTPNGGRIHIGLHRINSHIEITVSDTGEGISAELLPYIFERFRQSDSSRTREHGGLGLGLAIVKHIVELHGGTVAAHSAGEGDGAAFTVRLPVVPISYAQRVAAAPEHFRPLQSAGADLDLPPLLQGVDILVVENDPDTLAFLSSLLRSSGAQVRRAESAEAALRQLEPRPDLLLADIGMPGEDGYALIHKVRGWETRTGQHRLLPAIALTAYAHETDRLRALEAGYQLHVAKPIEPNELILAIANQLGITGKPSPQENI